MKKLSILKRSLCVFIASLMMISYSSCSKTGDRNSSGTLSSSVHQVREGHKIENYFTSSPFSVPDGITYVKSLKCTEDRIFYSGFNDTHNENAVMYFYDPSSGTLKNIDIESIGASDIRNIYLSDSGIYMYYKDSKDSFVLGRIDRESGKLTASTDIEDEERISSVYNDENGDLAVLTFKTDAVSSELRTFDSSTLKLKNTENLNEKLSIAEGEYICLIVPDGEKYYMFSQVSGQSQINLYVCDSKFEIIKKHESVTGDMKGEFSGAFISEDGKAGVITCDHTSMLSVYSTGLFDMDSEKLTGVYDPKLEKGSYVLPHTKIEGYDYIYSDGSAIYGCRAAEQTSEKVLDLVKDVSSDLDHCFSASVSGGMYLLHSVSYEDEGGLLNIVTDASGKVLYTIDIALEKDANLNNLTVLDGNNTAISELIYSEAANNEYSQTCRVHIIGEDGKEKSSFDVSGRETESEHEGSFGEIYYSNGNIYIPYNISNDGNGNPAGRLIVFDTDGNKKYTVISDDIIYIDKVIPGKDRNYFVYTDKSGDVHTAVIDEEGHKAGEDISFDASSESVIEIIGGTGDYDFCYSTSEGVFGYSYSGGSSELINWIDSDMNFDIQKICIINNDRMLCYVWDYNIGSNTLYVLDRADEALLSEIQNKEIITVAGVGISDSIIYDAVIYFNQNSSAFRIQLEDYEKYSKYSDEGFTGGEEKLNSEIEAGNIPDIIIGNRFVNMTAFASAGLFTDMNSFFERDKQSDRSLLIENVLDIFAAEGKQYQLPICFGIRTIAGKESVLGEETGWTLEKFLESAEKSDMFFRPGRSEMTSVLISENLSDYVDFSGKKCSFDKPEFIKLLEYIKKNGLSDAEYEAAVDEMTNVNDGNGKYKEYLRRFADNKCQAEMVEYSGFYEPASFENNTISEKAVFKGVPSASGNGCLIVPDVVVAIAEGSKKKDAAWGFVRGLIIDNFQAGMLTSYPVNMDVFDYYMTNARSNGSDSSFVNTDGEYVSSGILSDDTALKITSAVAGASRAVTADSHISDIVGEETNKFYNGEQSAEDTAGNIQSRVSEYLKNL